jgi:hypothetical protein
MADTTGDPTIGDSVHLGELTASDAAAAPPAVTTVDADGASAPPRRRRWLIGILVTVVVLVVLVVLAVVGWFVAESVLRQVAADRIRTVVVDSLGANPDEVQVEVGGGAIVPQLLGGSLDEVDIDLESMTVGAVTGAATVRAEGIPLAEGGTIERVVATVTLPGSSVAELAAIATGLPADAISVGDSTVSVRTEFDAFVTTVSIGVELALSALDGDIALEPVGVTLGDTAITAQELQGIPLIGSAASDLLQTRIICVANTLPASLTLTDLTVAGGEMRVTLRGNAVPTEQEALAVTGSC